MVLVILGLVALEILVRLFVNKEMESHLNKLFFAILLLYFSAMANAQQDFDETKLLAKQGFVLAQYNLGLMYDTGDGVPENHAEAVKWFRLAADQGVARAQASLGLMYVNGDGVPQNNVRAYVWWSVAAAQGNEDGRSNRDIMSGMLTPILLGQAQEIATKCFESDYQDCE